MKINNLIPLAALSLASPAFSQIVIDGTIAGDSYGPAVAVQGTETGFGDNLSEINACYATFEAGRLVFAITGNIEDNFNKLEIFLDTVPGGENVFTAVPGNDNTGVMAGFTFDAGFEADYHIIVRRGTFGTSKFDVDIAALGTANFSFHEDVFGGVLEGAGSTPTGPGNAFPIEVAYDNSNIDGVFGGNGPSDQNEALMVETGLEMAVSLQDLGLPSGDVKMCVFVNGSNHDYASNQWLGSVAPPQGNLGGDGAGNFTGTMVFDMNTFAGDQFFVVPSGNPGTNYCLATPNSTGSAAVASAAGSTSVAANNLTLIAGPVPAQPGLFFYGPNQIQILFGNGFRCVGGTVVRMTVGSPVGGFRNFPVDLPTFGITPGTLNFQYWYRDPAAGGSNFNLSDGLEIVFVP